MSRFTLDGLAKRMKKRKRVPAANRYAAFPTLCERMGLPKPVAELKFHPTRKWRFDFAWPEHKVALEIEGGLWISGGHSRGSGKLKDHQKFNAAAAHGWRLIFATPQNVFSTSTIETIKSAINYQST